MAFMALISSFYVYLKLFFWILFSFFIVRQADRMIVLSSFVVVGLFESFVGFLQFSFNQSIGVWGESLLTPFIRDVARVYLDPGLLLRAYGTFPHPNILAAFLILSIFSSLYFFVRARRGWLSLFLWTGILFVLFLGLIITFSRMAWIIIFFLLIYFFFIAWRRRYVSRSILTRVGIIVMSILFILSILFSWAIIPRMFGLTYENFTVQHRIVDYKRGLSLISQAPVLGHGLSLQMGNAPIHNAYIQIATEIGLGGLLLFLFYIFLLIRHSYFNHRDVLIRSMFVSFLFYGFTDHFWWTLRPGIGYFWIIIGLL